MEDVPGLRELVVGALDPWRFQVHVAAGVDAALGLAARRRFEAVICGDASTANALRRTFPEDAPRIVVLDESPLPSPETLRGTLLGSLPERQYH